MLQPYVLRNAVLSIMGEMVGHVLCQDNMDVKGKATRDRFLDKLEVGATQADVGLQWSS